jgi:hypothetical protein
LPPSASTSTPDRSRQPPSTPSRGARPEGLRPGGGPDSRVGQDVREPQVRLRVGARGLAPGTRAQGVGRRMRRGRGLQGAEAGGGQEAQERQARRRVPRPDARGPQRRRGVRPHRGGGGRHEISPGRSATPGRISGVRDSASRGSCPGAVSSSTRQTRWAAGGEPGRGPTGTGSTRFPSGAPPGPRSRVTPAAQGAPPTTRPSLGRRCAGSRRSGGGVTWRGRCAP